MAKLKIVTLTEQVENTLTDEDCDKFLDWLDTVITNSIWQDKIQFGDGEN